MGNFEERRLNISGLHTFCHYLRAHGTCCASRPVSPGQALLVSQEYTILPRGRVTHRFAGFAQGGISQAHRCGVAEDNAGLVHHLPAAVGLSEAGFSGFHQRGDTFPDDILQDRLKFGYPR